MVALVLGLLAPALLAVGVGVPTAVGAWQLALAHSALQAVVALLGANELLSQPGAWIWVPPIGGLIVWRLIGGTTGRPVARRLLLTVEVALALAAAVPAVWCLIIAVAMDPVVFAGGLIALFLVLPRGARRSGGAALRGVTAALAGGLLMVATASSVHGSSPASPGFALAELWLAGPGRSAWASGGVFLVPGVILGAVAALTVDRKVTGWPRIAWLGAVVLCVAVAELAAGQGRHLAVAEVLSALGVLACLVAAVRLTSRLPGAPPLAAVAALVICWSGLCVARSLAVTMWTRPPALPPGVELLTPQRGVFGIAVDRDSGVIAWSVRRESRIGYLLPDGSTGSWSLVHLPGSSAGDSRGPEADHEVEAIEEHDGTFWISIWRGDQTGGLLPFRPPARPDELVPTGSCNPTAWRPLGPREAADASAPPGVVLVGCEQRPWLAVLDPEALSWTPLPALDTGNEDIALDRARGRMWGVMLWGTSALTEREWPSGDVLRRRTIGPMNWTLCRARDRDWLVLGRFLEGGIEIRDPDSLDQLAFIPLSFGIRAVVQDPARDRIWATAPYSGQIWLVDADAPWSSRSWELCGGARDIAVDQAGRAVVGTACGIFRIDPSGASAGPL